LYCEIFSSYLVYYLKARATGYRKVESQMFHQFSGQILLSWDSWKVTICLMHAEFSRWLILLAVL